MSKFDAILQKKSPTSDEVSSLEQQLSGGVEVKKRGPGRPPGKRSNSAFKTVTVFLKKDTHKKLKLKLISEDSEHDVSETIQGLVETWLDEQGARATT